MMIELAFILAILLLPFGISALRGAPFVPTLQVHCEELLDWVPVGAGQRLIDLGSGDGRLLIAAARRGVKAIGYESNPILWGLSVMRTRKHRDLIKVNFGSFWMKNLPEVDVIYAFLGRSYMRRIDRKIQEESTSRVLLVTNTYPVPGRIPMRSLSYAHQYAY